MYQAVGYRIELQCFGEGNPIPPKQEAYWTRDGVPLPRSSDEYVSMRCFVSVICSSINTRRYTHTTESHFIVKFQEYLGLLEVPRGL